MTILIPLLTLCLDSISNQKGDLETPRLLSEILPRHTDGSEVSQDQPPVQSSPPLAANVNPVRLAVFTLVRGGTLEEHYTSFVNSRACLREVLPPALVYDNVAFHEGNVPAAMQRALSPTV